MVGLFTCREEDQNELTPRVYIDVLKYEFHKCLRRRKVIIGGESEHLNQMPVML